MKKILVIGASGFVGSSIVEELLTKDYTVHCLARNPTKLKSLADKGCEIFQGDILDPVSLQKATDSVDAVYISIHTLSPQSGNEKDMNFADVELEGIQNIISACKTNGVKRVIYVTFLGSTPDSDNAWVRGRWDAEQLLFHSGLDATVIGPGMIVGLGGQGYDSIVNNAKKGVAFILGFGKQKFSNIAITDLTYYLVGILNDSRSYGQRYDVGGDEILTTPQMIDIVAEILGRRHPKKIYIPVFPIRFLASVIERMSKMPKGAIKSLINSLKSDVCGDTNPIKRILPRPLLTFRQASKQALKRQINID